MTVSDNTPSSPSPGFDRFGFSSDVARGIAAAGFDRPRPIQARAIPAALEGRDVMGLAQTGTGKTAAFALPILERLSRQRGSSAVRALVLAPTRELATQIQAEFQSLARFTGLDAVALFGGVSIHRNIRALRRNPDVVIGCPGRVLDLLNRGVLKLGKVESLVLDEADHMFDMGFLPDVRKILAAVPGRRQNLLFSATMPGEIRSLADQMLRDPEVVELGGSGPAETIEHVLVPVGEGRKRDLLELFLRDEGCDSAIVFTRTKHRARKLARQLEEAGHRAVGLQGNMSQSQRDRAMQGFRDRRFKVLVATDIVARGIDVREVSHVINFDVPNTPEAYKHRIGRTGRSEREGQAVTFVTREDGGWLRATERQLGGTIERRPVEGFEGEPIDGTGSAQSRQRRGSRRPGSSGRGPGSGRRPGGRQSRGRGRRGRRSAAGSRS